MGWLDRVGDDMEKLKDRKRELEGYMSDNEVSIYAKGGIAKEIGNIDSQLGIPNPINESLSREVILEKVIDCQNDYLKLLGEELTELVGIASVHGWRSTRYEEGKSLRDKMADIKKLLDKGK